jgi:hypothetical protein
MAFKDQLRTAVRVLAVAVYVVLGHALLAAWWRPTAAVSMALEAVLCGLAAWGVTRGTDGRWRGPALVGLLVEALRSGFDAGMGGHVDVGASLFVVPVVGAAMAWAARRRPS